MIGTITASSFNDKFKVVGGVGSNGLVRFENSSNQADVNHGTLQIVNTAAYAIGNDASIGFSLSRADNSYQDPRASIGAKTESSYGGALVFNTRSDVGTYSEKLRITGIGNVGIATVTPFSLLHVGTRPGAGNTNPSLGSIATISNDGLTGIDLGANVNANTVVGHINWVNGIGVANHNTARIDVYATGGTNSGSLRFWTASAASSPTIRLTIASTGDATFTSSVTATNLYLGSLTNEQLMISGTGSRGIGVSTITSGDPYFRLYNNTTIVGDMWWGRSGNFQGINSLGAGSITAINPFGGNVLIGTITDAGYKLDVNGTGRFSGNTTIIGNIIFNTNATTRQIWNGGYGGAVELRRSDVDTNRFSRIGIVDNPGNFLGGLTINSDTSATFSSSVTANGGLFSSNISSLTYEASSAGAIQPGVSEFISTGFNVAGGTSQDISTISLPSNTQWKAIITGGFANNFEGGGLTSPNFSRDIDGTNSTISVGSTTLTFSRNSSTGKLQVSCSNAPYRATFVGTIHLVTFPQSIIPSNTRAFFGNVGINTTTPSTLFHVYSTASADTTGYIQYENGSSGTGSAANAQLIGKSRYGTAQLMVWENYGIRFGMRSTANGGAGSIFFTTGTDSVGMVLTSSNRLLVGGITTDSGYALDVSGSSRITGQFLQGSGGARSTNGTTIALTNNTTFSANSDIGDGARFLSIVNESTVVSAFSNICFRINPASGGSSGNVMLDMKFVNDGSVTSTLYWTFLHGGSWSDRMALTSAGDLLINASATTQGAKLYVNGIAAFGSVYVGALSTGTVYSNAGFLTNTNPSDYRLKNTIKPLTYGLNEILQLNPKTFYYNDDILKSSLKYGFIAQDVKEVMPELARKLDSNSEYLGLETEGIFVTLVNAVKELKAELDLIKNK
jgi:hypothetical protein